jgi:CcmD family protein
LRRARFTGAVEPKKAVEITAFFRPKKVGGPMKNLDSLMAAYLAVWAIFFVYHFTVARRVARLQDEIARLKQNLKQ